MIGQHLPSQLREWVSCRSPQQCDIAVYVGVSSMETVSREHWTSPRESCPRRWRRRMLRASGRLCQVYSSIESNADHLIALFSLKSCQRSQFVSDERVRVRLRMATSSRWVSWRTGSHTGCKWATVHVSYQIVQKDLAQGWDLVSVLHTSWFYNMVCHLKGKSEGEISAEVERGKEGCFEGG